MAFQVFWEEAGAYKKFFGHVNDDELVRSVSGIHGDRRFDDLRYVINNFLDVDSFDVTEENLMYVAAIDGAAARTNPHIRIAIVVADAKAIDLARRYIASPWTAYPTRIFQSIEEARAWLDVPDQPASKP